MCAGPGAYTDSATNHSSLDPWRRARATDDDHSALSVIRHQQPGSIHCWMKAFPSRRHSLAVRRCDAPRTTCACEPISSLRLRVGRSLRRVPSPLLGCHFIIIIITAPVVPSIPVRDVPWPEATSLNSNLTKIKRVPLVFRLSPRGRAGNCRAGNCRSGFDAETRSHCTIHHVSTEATLRAIRFFFMPSHLSTQPL